MLKNNYNTNTNTNTNTIENNTNTNTNTMVSFNDKVYLYVLYSDSIILY